MPAMTKPPPKKVGRPRIADNTVTMNIRMSFEQREKVKENGGGQWVRHLIDHGKPAALKRAKPPR